MKIFEETELAVYCNNIVESRSHYGKTELYIICTNSKPFGS